MSEVKETTFLVQHESCECKCRFNESVCNLKPKQKHNECWCECKGLDDEFLVKMIICRILTRVIVNVIKHIKLMNI